MAFGGRLSLGALLLVMLVMAVSCVQGQAGDPDYVCSADKPCAVGCCDKFGVCGMGPDFCSSANCVNSCDAKAECDPSNWGPTYAASEGCPLNVCCSQFGFCGTTEEFCGNTQISNPNCPGGQSALQRTVGYYEGWAVTRSCDAMEPEQIPLGTYTHLNFAFAMIDPNTFAVAAMSPGDIDLYPRLTGLKTLFPNLQVWISIGGWSMNDPDQPTATTFSDLAGSTANQEKFFASLISFMSEYGFDGVDIDWEYPVAPERSGVPEDFQNYPIFLGNLKSAFQGAGKSWGLSITLPSSFWYLQNFDIVKLESIVDWFNMMEYDLHGVWDATDVWVGPFVAAHTNLTEIDQSLKLLWRNNISPSKVTLGLGFYGRSFTLANPSCNTAGCEFTGGAPAGDCTDDVGTLSYAEIEAIIAAGAQPQLDAAAAVQTVVYGDGNYWVSFDDKSTFATKIAYANENCLGGTMVWAASLDDSQGSAATALGGSGLISTFRVGIPTVDNVASCSWTECSTAEWGSACPPGYTTATQVLDGCPQPAGNPYNYRNYCCPSNDPPSCTASVTTGGLTSTTLTCQANPCAFGSTLVANSHFFAFPDQPCVNGGTVNVCCTNTLSTSLVVNECQWTDCSPEPQCPSGTQLLTKSLSGLGGDVPCSSGWRGLCCPTGPGGLIPSTCSWVRNVFNGVCQPGCPDGKAMVAVDSMGAGCFKGYGSFCCGPTIQDTTGGDPAVLAFQSLVQDFLTNGVCELTPASSDTNPSKKKKRQTNNSQVSNNEVGQELGTLMYHFQVGTVSPDTILPYLLTWNAQLQIAGSSLPTYQTLDTNIPDTLNGLGDNYNAAIAQAICPAMDCTVNMYMTGSPSNPSKRDNTGVLLKRAGGSVHTIGTQDWTVNPLNFAALPRARDNNNVLTIFNAQTLVDPIVAEYTAGTQQDFEIHSGTPVSWNSRIFTSSIVPNWGQWTWELTVSRGLNPCISNPAAFQETSSITQTLTPEELSIMLTTELLDNFNGETPNYLRMQLYRPGNTFIWYVSLRQVVIGVASEERVGIEVAD
ncbi:glycoside hydrolase family 18 protein [Stipitochalara longipes BDJ]|nr:glycoside hydrolase family 18 protein [Stipitochalara longipes BDJ]